ncbi:Na+-transporting NADH:ubiquinone oxidoreductase subunit F [Hoeflea halophila]|uniref:Na(+)-translocating NADH-quinone reductase subunit F n=1 Tax=Hoeflea halophila TaxID=714899 RepID=A0A286IDL8_9HYPH|nr:NADH:ubiquinone reductase (Na(+)-transporting) subunit F [Hoeflea halophila]SOE18233.1 Na+-transporting NADH:ubiquinone oxidoreductase subunit F [Hoeflea halophila]
MTEVFMGVGVITLIITGLTALIGITRRVLMPAVPVKLTINGKIDFEGTTNSKLLGVLNNHGIAVPSACAGAGTCGLCRVKVAGADAPLPTETARLTRAQLRNGERLACQVTVRGPLHITVPDGLIGVEPVEVTVVANRSLTPFIRELVLEYPEGQAPAVKAGDYIQLEAPPYQLDFADIEIPYAHRDAWVPVRHLKSVSREPVTRAYSISNRLEDTRSGRLVLNIRLALPPPHLPGTPPGIVSSWLFALNEGDTIMATGPFGSFRAQQTQNEMIFIGGGVGMAPLRAIILEELEIHNSSRPMSYWYGARERRELIYVDELDRLANLHSNFRWVSVLSQPAKDDAWEGATGFVHDVVMRDHLASHPAPEECEYYLCGPPLMIKAVMAMLDELGVEPDNIFSDDFGV